MEFKEIAKVIDHELRARQFLVDFYKSENEELKSEIEELKNKLKEYEIYKTGGAIGYASKEVNNENNNE